MAASISVFIPDEGRSPDKEREFRLEKVEGRKMGYHFNKPEEPPAVTIYSAGKTMIFPWVPGIRVIQSD